MAFVSCLAAPNRSATRVCARRERALPRANHVAPPRQRCLNFLRAFPDFSDVEHRYSFVFFAFRGFVADFRFVPCRLFLRRNEPPRLICVHHEDRDLKVLLGER